MASSLTETKSTTATASSTSIVSTPASVSTPTSQLNPVSQSPTTSATTPIPSTTSSETSTSSASSPSVGKLTTSASSSGSSQEVGPLTSTTGSQSPASSNPTSTSRPSPSTLPNHRLSNGTVAGIVVGAALGLALITFLATFAIMRRQRQSKSKKRSRYSGDGRRVGLPPQHQGSTGVSRTHDNHLPQSADDRTIQQKVRSTLDQMELHVENFYRNPSSSTLRPSNGELAVFDSPYLSAPLASLLPHSKNKLNIIKHALVQSVTSALSPTADPTRSLIPTEYTLLPSTITATKSNVTLKPEFTQIMSQWRVTTAYLHPDPTKDPNYISKRDRQISDIVQSFARAFAPWKSTGYKDEERARSLSAILEDAANLGIFLFSQPSTLNFYWPAAGDIRSGKVVVSPALLKTADEKGGKLAEALIMVDQILQDV